MTVSTTCAIGEVPRRRTVTDTYNYDAFGNELSSTGTTPNQFLYRGEQYDSDLSLYYLRARYYNPATGRFLSRDPEEGKAKDPKTLHQYLFAGGNPVNALDPTGKAIIAESVFGITIPLSVIQVGAAWGIACGVLENGGGAFFGYEETSVDKAFCHIVFWLDILILPDPIPKAK